MVMDSGWWRVSNKLIPKIYRALSEFFTLAKPVLILPIEIDFLAAAAIF